MVNIDRYKLHTQKLSGVLSKFYDIKRSETKKGDICCSRRGAGDGINTSWQPPISRAKRHHLQRRWHAHKQVSVTELKTLFRNFLYNQFDPGSNWSICFLRGRRYNTHYHSEKQYYHYSVCFHIRVYQICAIYCDFRVYKLVPVDNPGLNNSSTLLYMRYAKIKILPRKSRGPGGRGAMKS